MSVEGTVRQYGVGAMLIDTEPELEEAIRRVREALIDRADEWAPQATNETMLIARIAVEALDPVGVGVRHTDDGVIEPVWRFRRAR